MSFNMSNIKFIIYLVFYLFVMKIIKYNIEKLPSVATRAI